MAVYYKFKSERNFRSVSVNASFISAWDLKIKIIFETYSKGASDGDKLVIGTDFDLELTNAQTNEVYTDDTTLIPRNTTVFVRRVPGVRCRPIVIEQENLVWKFSKDAASGIEVVSESTSGIEKVSESRSTLSVAYSGMSLETRENQEGCDFGDDIFASPKVGAVESNDLRQKHMIVEERKIKELADRHAEEDKKIEELANKHPEADRKIKELANKHAEEDRKIQAFVEGLERGLSCSIGRGKLLERKTPPGGYICRRCKMPGHYIHYCPTNDDPSYDIKQKRPTLKPNEDSFLESIAASRSAPLNKPPPELLCPLCKKLIRDAAFTSKCCFRSFCDECIRDHIISKSVCACGAREMLADTLIPNRTLREIINRFLESRVSEEKTRISSQSAESKPSSCCTQSKVSAPAPPVKESTSGRKRSASDGQAVMCTSQKTSGDSKSIPESEVITEKAPSRNELAAHGHTLLADEKIQQRLPVGEPGKKKKKTMRTYTGGSVEESMTQNQYMNFGAAYNYRYWAGMQMQRGGNGGYMVPYSVGVPDFFQDLFGVPPALKIIL
ncbi:hypothetical protein ACLOJK_005748 [Asimina triloba]